MTILTFRRLRPFIALLMVLLAQRIVAADKLAVVVDVSGSMKGYGQWQADAREAVTTILAGNHTLPRWNIEPAQADLNGFACGPEGRLVLLRFGSVQPTADYPFFNGIQDSVTSADLASRFPSSPSEYTDNRTNKALAEAVAIRSVVDQEGHANVIMISDFYSDASLSDRQLAFINDTEDKFKKVTVATLSWVGNPRVQIKLLRFEQIDSQTAPLPKERATGVLHLSTPRYNADTGSIHYMWNFDGGTQPKSYDIGVTDQEHRKVLFSRSGLAEGSVTYPKAVAGPERWAVTAYMPDGTVVEQGSTFIVPSQNSSSVGKVLLFLIALAGLGGGAIMLKRVGLPEFLRPKEHSNDDF